MQPYIDAGRLRAFSAGEWLDCGNLDFLTSSRRRLLQARSFNAIQIDDLRGTLTKRSQHGAKFLNEINYYRLVPKDLATFFPRLVDFSLAPKDLWLTLEYYGYPTLSEIWVFEEFESAYWKNVFLSLQRILACFAQYSAEISASPPPLRLLLAQDDRPYRCLRRAGPEIRAPDPFAKDRTQRPPPLRLAAHPEGNRGARPQIVRQTSRTDHPRRPLFYQHPLRPRLAALQIHRPPRQFRRIRHLR